MANSKKKMGKGDDELDTTSNARLRTRSGLSRRNGVFDLSSGVTYPEIWRSPYEDCASLTGHAVLPYGDAASSNEDLQISGYVTLLKLTLPIFLRKICGFHKN